VYINTDCCPWQHVSVGFCSCRQWLIVGRCKVRAWTFSRCEELIIASRLIAGSTLYASYSCYYAAAAAKPSADCQWRLIGTWVTWQLCCLHEFGAVYLMSTAVKRNKNLLFAIYCYHADSCPQTGNEILHCVYFGNTLIVVHQFLHCVRKIVVPYNFCQ